MSTDPRLKPSSLISKLLKTTLDRSLFDSVYGDLCEDFAKNYKSKGLNHARWIFLIESLGFMLRSRKMNLMISKQKFIMKSLFQTFTKTAVRHFRRKRAYFMFNLIGLSIGIASSLIILQYVNFQKSFDNFHKEGIYRLNRSLDDGTIMANSTADVSPAIQREIAQVSSSTRFFPRKDGAARIETNTGLKTFKDVSFLFIDDQFFDVFSFSGDKEIPKALLEKPNMVILTESLAEKTFGTANAIGQIVSFKDTNFPLFDCEVAAVVPDVPKNSHFSFDALITMTTPVRRGNSIDKFGWQAFYTYIDLGQTNAETIETQLSSFSDSYFIDAEQKFNFELQPIKDIYLKSETNNELGKTGDLDLVKYFSMAAIFILIMAYVNYINLSTSQSIDRSKEIGIRKVLGSKNSYIKFQMLVETLVMNVIALAVAVLLIALFERFVQIDGVGIAYFSIEEVGIVISIIVLCSYLSGLYPANLLSVLSPISVLNNRLFSTGGSTNLRSVLTIVQFSISALMLMITIVVTNQIQYMINHNNGISLDQVLIVKPPSIRSSEFRKQMEVFKNKLHSRSFVESVSTASTTPGMGYNYAAQARMLSGDPENSILVYVDGIDDNFVEHYDLKLLSGRSFNRSFAGERGKVVINQKTALLLDLGTPDEAVAKKMILEGDTLEIIGVLTDYNHRGLTSDYDPQVLAFYGNYSPHFSIRINAHNTSELIANISLIEEDYAVSFNGDVPDYFFLDDKFNEQYNEDIVANKVSWYFTIISLTITIIGLIGFVSYMLSRRLKEVAIRRVLGAMRNNILYKLSVPLLKTLLVATVLATSLGYYFADSWLSQYAFRIDLSLFHFLIPVITIGFISISILVIRSLNTVSQNPVNFLRDE